MTDVAVAVNQINDMKKEFCVNRKFEEEVKNRYPDLYVKASEGDAKSQCELALAMEGFLYTDYETVGYWYKKAAMQKYIPAYLLLGDNLGDMFDEYEEALDWYIKAAEAGDVEGIRELFSEIDSYEPAGECNAKIISCLEQLQKTNNVEAKRVLDDIRNYYPKQYHDYTVSKTKDK